MRYAHTPPAGLQLARQQSTPHRRMLRADKMQRWMKPPQSTSRSRWREAGGGAADCHAISGISPP
jgi:hypothetical protein